MLVMPAYVKAGRAGSIEPPTSYRPTVSDGMLIPFLAETRVAAVDRAGRFLSIGTQELAHNSRDDPRHQKDEDTEASHAITEFARWYR